MPDQNVDLARRALEAYNARDIETLLAYSLEPLGAPGTAALEEVQP